MLNAQLPARRRAAVALVVLAASAAFGVADAGAADPNATDNTNAGCRYVARPARSIPAGFRRQALMCALNRARLVNHAAPLRMEPTLTGPPSSIPRARCRSSGGTAAIRSSATSTRRPAASPSSATSLPGFCRTGSNPGHRAHLLVGGGAAGSPTAAVNAWLTDGTQRLVLLRPPGLYAGPGMAPGSAYNPPDPDRRARSSSTSAGARAEALSG